MLSSIIVGQSTILTLSCFHRAAERKLASILRQPSISLLPQSSLSFFPAPLHQAPVLRNATTHPLSPRPIAPRPKLPPHHADHFPLAQPCSLLDLFERRSIFPRQSNNKINLTIIHKIVSPNRSPPHDNDHHSSITNETPNVHSIPSNSPGNLQTFSVASPFAD